MPASEPVLHLSPQEKRLLVLLGQLALEGLDRGRRNTNRVKERIYLNDSEASELASRLHQLANSREFWECTTFIEGITQSDADDNRSLREIYLSRRKKTGRTRVMASTRWEEFLVRLGAGPRRRPYVSPEELPWDLFLRLERKLLLEGADLPPQIVEYINELIESKESEVRDYVHRRRMIPTGGLRRVVISVLNKLNRDIQHGLDIQISTTKAASIIALIADSSVIFTTRDWGAVGTYSSIAAWSISAIGSD